MDHRLPPPITDAPWASPGTEVVAPRPSSAPTTFPEPAPSRAALAGSPVDRLQPQTIGELLDGGFEVLRFRFRTIVVVAATIVLPLYAIPQAVAVWATPTGAAGSTLLTPAGELSDGLLGDVGAAILLGFVAQLGLALAAMLTGVAVAHLVGSWLRGVDPTPGDTFRFLRSRLLTSTGAWALALLVKLGAALVTCGFGLLFVVPVLSVLAPVVAVEGTSATDSLTRAFALGRRRYGRVLGVGILWGLASGLVSLAAQGAAGAIGALVTNSVEGTNVAVQVVTIAGTVILTVVQVAVTVLVYVDLRVRTEGLDLELSAAERFAEPVGAA